MGTIDPHMELTDDIRAKADQQIDEWVNRGSFLTVHGEHVFIVDVPASPQNQHKTPILISHGFPTSSLDWRHVVDGMAGERRIVAFDYPGFGASDKAHRSYSLFEQARVLADVARQVGLTEVVLASHDMGTSIAGEFRAMDLDGELPDLEILGRVMCSASIYIKMAHVVPEQQTLLSSPDVTLPAEIPPELTNNLPADTYGFQGLVGVLGTAREPDTVEIAAMARECLRNEGARIYPRTIQCLRERVEHEERWTGALESHGSPVSVLWPDAAPIEGFDMAEKFMRRRPDAHLTRFADIGHYPMNEIPEEFTHVFRESVDLVTDEGRHRAA